MTNTKHHGIRVLFCVLYLVTVNFAYQATTIDVEENLVQVGKTYTRNFLKYRENVADVADVADEAFTIFSAIEKSHKATSLELSNEIYEGDDVKLTCVVPNRAADVFWRFKNNNLESSDTKVNGRSKLVMLHMKDITPSSSGKYRCVVKKGESEEFQEIVLKVDSISKPYHSDAESRPAVTVNYDETFVIDCGMTGKPLPDVKWFKDGHPYTSGEMEGNLLKVSRARAEDNGKFERLAVNRAGSTRNFIEVEVDGGPELSPLFYWVGTIVVLGCIGFVRYLFNKRNMLHEDLRLLPIEERTDYLRIPKKFKIAEENLEICEEIGSGMFGLVHKGYLSMADPKSQIEYKTRLPVVIKSTKYSFDVHHPTMLFEELEIMCAIDKHPNIISLIGANMRQGMLYLVTEYADNGDLLNYLRKHRETFHNTLIDMEEPVIKKKNWCRIAQRRRSVNLLNFLRNHRETFHNTPTESNRILPPGDTLSTSDLLSFALQIANGMKFLAAVPCVHRDLAARHVLITSSKICRISGFKKRYTEKDYIRAKIDHSVAPSVRWLAPEAMKTFKFTEKTDVWSYGMTLYEIFTLGGRPHVQTGGLKAFWKRGKRNERPEYCPDDVYGLMKQCWKKYPDSQPNFSACFNFFNARMKECSGELLARVDKQLHMDHEKQNKLGEWLMKNRPKIQEGPFTSRPTNNEEPPTETERATYRIHSC